jgi:molybdate transport system substrate-binding protein
MHSVPRPASRSTATFGAGGRAAREARRECAPCDIVVLTASMIDAMAASGQVNAGTVAALGRVRTGVALREGDAPAGHSRRRRLARERFSGARRPSTSPIPSAPPPACISSTIVRRLGHRGWRCAAAGVRFPNGATAMRALADSRVPGEIRLHPGDGDSLYARRDARGRAAAEFELATVYSAAVMRERKAPCGEGALGWLADRGPALRTAGGFEHG